MNMDILSINVGMPTEVNYQMKTIVTGIYKTPVTEPVFVSKVQIEGDGQADLIAHGGIDKAVCVYGYDHYPYWEERLQKRLGFGAFGENLTTNGMTEQDVMIGDIFQAGEVLLQVSQPRQPCFKLSVKWNEPTLPMLVRKTGFSGFYFRVFKEGYIEKGYSLKLVERHKERVSVSFANNVMYIDKTNKNALEKLVQLDVLADAWKQSFTRQLKGLS